MYFSQVKNAQSWMMSVSTEKVMKVVYLSIRIKMVLTEKSN